MTHTPPMESFNEINLAAQSLKKLILSNVLNAEGKMVLEHAIDKLSQETDAILDITNDIPKPCQKELLLGYTRLLQCNIDSVNRKIAKLVYR
jgi:hypothetical protein